jgi:hypothetical protein
LLLLALPLFGCGETRIMSEENTGGEKVPQGDPSPEAKSIPALEKFIFEPDEFSDAIVPRRLLATDVAKFLTTKIKKDLSLESWRQVEKAADFYDSTEVPEKYRTFLERKETASEDILRSIVIVRIIAMLGNADEREFARQYYLFLIPKTETLEQFQDLISLHERLGLGSNAGELRRRIQAKLAVLEARKEADYQSRLEYLKFQETIPATLDGVEKAQAIKDKTLKLADRQQRLDDEIRMYVTTEYGYQDYLLPFAARRIRRETWAASIADQTVRNDKAPMKDDVVRSLRKFLEAIEKRIGIEREDKQAYRIRILRAVRFFGGKLSENEEGFLRENRGRQVDVLANEGFMIKS